MRSNKSPRRAGRSVVQHIAVGRKVTIDSAIEEWTEWMDTIGRSFRTVDNHGVVVRAWAREMKLGHVGPASISEKQIHPWVNDASDSKVGTRKVNLSALRSFFNFCVAKEYTRIDPTRLVRVTMKGLTHKQKEPREKKIFTDAEYKRLMHYLITELEAAEKRALKSPRAERRASLLRFWSLACPISRYAGLRLGDICQLEWDCFAKPRKMVVWTDKRDMRVSLPLVPELADAVARIPINTKTYCFPEEQKIITSKKRAKFSVYFGELCHLLELKGHSFHDLRHTYCTECYKKGVPMPHIASLVGHRVVKTTEGYIHV